MNTGKLLVRALKIEDRWKDMARVPGDYRVDVRGKRIHRGKICNVIIGDKKKLLAIRGWPEKDVVILMDSPTRLDLGIKVGTSYEMELHLVKWLGYWRWAWGAADPAYRVPA